MGFKSLMKGGKTGKGRHVEKSATAEKLSTISRQVQRRKYHLRAALELRGFMASLGFVASLDFAPKKAAPPPLEPAQEQSSHQQKLRALVDAESSLPLTHITRAAYLEVPFDFLL